MKVNAFARLAVGAGAGALALGALALPAQADPAAGTHGTLVGLGSDTTQDVLNAVAAAVPGNLLASYDATGSSTVATRVGGTAVPRANGSGAGRDLLRLATGQTTSANIATASGGTLPVTTQDVFGSIDFARSSSGPSAADVRPDGVLTYIPFASDAVTYAVAPNSVVPSNLTKDQLKDIYQGAYDRVQVLGGVSSLLRPTDTPAAGSTTVKLTTFIPQAGSGTRSYWLGQVGITENDISTSKYPNVTDKDFAGQQVQEHHGQALVSGTPDQDAGAIAPFSAGQWVAQANGKVTDNRAGVVLGKVAGTSAVQGSGTAYSLDPAYAGYTRLVYDIVPSRLADDPSSDIHKAFVGTDSEVCKQSSVITAYGFGLLTGGVKCGDTTTRAYAAATSPSSITLGALPSSTVGRAATLSATVTSVGVGGGTVTFAKVSGGVATTIASAKVAAGDSVKATASWTPTAVGTTDVLAYFVPALAGVDAPAPTATAPLVATAVPAVSSTTTVAVSSKPMVGHTMTLSARVSATKYASGKVSFYDGSTRLGTVPFSTTTHTAKLAIKATRTAYSVKAVYQPASTTVVKSSSSSSLSVRVAKDSSSVSVATIKSVHASYHGSVSVRIVATGVTPTGTVTVRQGSVVLGHATLRSGAARITLPRLSVGTHHLVVSYSGSTTVASSTSSVKSIKVVR
ncbi:Ig-like domain repeat protein [Luteimicrobium subarcticum]|uniref:ABC-type phosphate transport system substrate-binding protein n=1 Tax=Luteimicrobium subarcticum TaxID=620910 RepID=A0A2M8WT02_9MICO|nr:Ig-like domain repeat protein [Luteimicrobium subarcticum]PJI94034.1 ABC-type phosphate transport system substrate-binding protein [Luteimicrobium subarcticum]